MRSALLWFCLLLPGTLLVPWDAHAQESSSEAGQSAETEQSIQVEQKSSSDDTTVGDTVVLESPDVEPRAKTFVPKVDQRTPAPDVYLLPDEKGKLRKVLGFRYEDFLRAWKQIEVANPSAPPSYVIDQWKVVGEATEANVRLSIEFDITVQTDGWISIPVQLPALAIQQIEIPNQSAGECLVYDKQSHGHVLWLSGQAGKRRRLLIIGLAKLSLSQAEQRLELYLPRAVKTQFLVRVPKTLQKLKTSPQLELVTRSAEPGTASLESNTASLESNTTEVEVIGQTNPMQLSWVASKGKESTSATLAEVTGNTLVSLSRRRVNYDATLEVNSFGRPLQQIQVRLPANTKLDLSSVSKEFQVDVIDQSSADQRQLVEIRPAVPREKPWAVRLAAERPLESFGDSTECEIEGFEVVDAFRQSGVVTLEVDDQIQAYFDTHGDIVQVPADESSPSNQNSSILGQFRYARLPWQLAVHASPRQRRISVEPLYHLIVRPEGATLDVTYEYQLLGANVFSLRVDLHDWKRTEVPIESRGLVDPAGVVETRDGMLVLPLTDSDAQQVRLSFSLRKDTQLGENVFLLPEPAGAFVIDGELRVESAESLRVTPELSRLEGLSALSTADDEAPNSAAVETAKLPATDLFRTFLPQARFVAEVSERARQVSVALKTTIEVDQIVARVRQHLDYHSKYHPVSTLLLNLPKELTENESLTITLEGEPLQFGLASSTGEGLVASDQREAASDGAALQSILVSLPRAMQGRIPLEVEYVRATPELSTDELTPIQLPLIAPTDRVTSHEANVSSTPFVAVSLNQRFGTDDWQVLSEVGETGGNSDTIQLQTDEQLSQISLFAQQESVDQEKLATVQRTWIQSWISARQRQERAVFRFRTVHEVVYVQLPSFESEIEIEVLLDGEPIQFELFADNRLMIALAAPSADSHCLEVRYQTNAPLASWKDMRIALPRLEARETSSPFFWQLVAPRGWQIVGSPSGLIPDYWLGWKNFRWGRQPNFSQADLERVTGARSAPALTPLSTQYVFRALEVPTEIRVTLVQQPWIFAGVALVAFGVGLLLLYTKLGQSGAFWLAVALTLLTGAFTYPEVALLLLQAIAASALMIAATVVLRKVFLIRSDGEESVVDFAVERSTEITESWQQLEGSQVASETTATLRTSGPSS